VVSFIFLDSHNPELARKQREACLRLYERTLDWEGETPFAISIHSVYTVCQENILWANQFALDHGLKVHLHLAETRAEDEDCRHAHGGLSPTEYFEQLGILGPHVIAAHALHLSDSDVRILGDRHVNCVHNIDSNLKLASGFRFRYNELRNAGANVCLGTDGAASANNMDMLEHMKNSAMVQKAWRRDPAALPLGQLLASATENGAKALGLNSGVIREGALADLSLIDITGTAFISPAPTLANLVYAAHSDVITDVMSGGRWIMRNRVVPNEEEIVTEARKVLKQITE
jgi:5-methylthioadenosine/S-adenosylhomocysteine deaminase